MGFIYCQMQRKKTTFDFVGMDLHWREQKKHKINTVCNHFLNIWFSRYWTAAFFYDIPSPLLSVRVNYLRLSRTMEDPLSLWKNKKWSGLTSPCRACMKTHQALEAEGLIWDQTIGKKHTCTQTLDSNACVFTVFTVFIVSFEGFPAEQKLYKMILP